MYENNSVITCDEKQRHCNLATSPRLFTIRLAVFLIPHVSPERKRSHTVIPFSPTHTQHTFQPNHTDTKWTVAILNITPALAEHVFSFTKNVWSLDGNRMDESIVRALLLQTELQFATELLPLPLFGVSDFDANPGNVYIKGIGCQDSIW
jgi:hypothetical protein